MLLPTDFSPIETAKAYSRLNRNKSIDYLVMVFISNLKPLNKLYFSANDQQSKQGYNISFYVHFSVFAQIIGIYY